MLDDNRIPHAESNDDLYASEISLPEIDDRVEDAAYLRERPLLLLKYLDLATA